MLIILPKRKFPWYVYAGVALVAILAAVWTVNLRFKEQKRAQERAERLMQPGVHGFLELDEKEARVWYFQWNEEVQELLVCPSKDSVTDFDDLMLRIHRMIKGDEEFFAPSFYTEQWWGVEADSVAKMPILRVLFLPQMEPSLDHSTPDQS